MVTYISIYSGPFNGIGLCLRIPIGNRLMKDTNFDKKSNTKQIPICLVHKATDTLVSCVYPYSTIV